MTSAPRCLIAGIGSGADFAEAAARALMEVPGQDALGIGSRVQGERGVGAAAAAAAPSRLMLYRAGHEFDLEHDNAVFFPHKTSSRVWG